MSMRAWSKFKQVAVAITASGQFHPTEHGGLRFAYCNGTEIDLLPHRAIAHPGARMR